MVLQDKIYVIMLFSGLRLLWWCECYIYQRYKITRDVNAQKVSSPWCSVVCY